MCSLYVIPKDTFHLFGPIDFFLQPELQFCFFLPHFVVPATLRLKTLDWVTMKFSFIDPNCSKGNIFPFKPLCFAVFSTSHFRVPIFQQGLNFDTN